MGSIEKKVKIRIRHEMEDFLKPGEEGALGNFNGGAFELNIFWEKNSMAPVCIAVDGKKNILEMKNHSINPFAVHYRMRIPVEKNGEGTITKYPGNNMRIILFGNGGTWEHWEIAVVAQRNLFFLTKQRTYQSCFFKNQDDNICCPDFDKKWPQLAEALKPHIKRKGLLPLSQYNPAKEKPRAIPDGQGICKWWNLAQGLGAIKISNNSYIRVHWTSVSNGHKLAQLFPGQKVTYKKISPIKIGRSGFGFEAKGVFPSK